MDAVAPALVEAEAALAATPGVRAVGAVRLRWIGHRLHAETDLGVDPALSVVAAHAIAVDAEHRLMHAARGDTAPHIADPHAARGDTPPGPHAAPGSPPLTGAMSLRGHR